MNIIDLATKTMQTAIKTVVDGMNSGVDAIKTTTDATATKVNSIDTNVGTLLNGRVVKSVQRGTIKGDSVMTSAVIKISAVDISKSLIFLDGTYDNNGVAPIVSIFNSNTSFTLSGSSTTVLSVSYTISWQVVEFY